MPAVEVAELVVRYGEVDAVRGLNFTVDAGEVVTLLGPNGAGKTTTVETIEGFRRPDGGSVRVLGADPMADRRTVVGQLGVMLQAGGVYPGVRPLEMLELLAAFYDEPDDPEALLGRVGLVDRARQTYRQLSGGEQQRLSLAMALIGRPRVVVLDEPTAGIDVAGRQLVRGIIHELRDAGVAVLVTTHDLDEAERIADRIVIVDRWVLVGAGTPAELMQGGDRLRFGAAPGLDVAALGSHLGAPVTEESPGEYLVGTEPTPTVVATLTSWLAAHQVALADLRAGRQRLEDVFVTLTSEASTAVRDADARRDRNRR